MGTSAGVGVGRWTSKLNIESDDLTCCEFNKNYILNQNFIYAGHYNSFDSHLYLLKDILHNQHSFFIQVGA